MRILMVSDVFFPRVNGVSTSIQTYRADLLALGHRCLLVAPEYPAGRTAGEDADVVRIAARAVPRDPEDRLLSWKRLRQWSDSLRPGDVDVVHVQTPFTAHYAGVRIARRLGVPVIESYHTYFEHYLQHYVPALPAALTRRLARRVTRSQCQQVDALISPSRSMADALRAYGITTPIEVLPTGLPPSCFVAGSGERFRQRQGIAATRPLALFVGRVAHEKNIDFLIRMLVALRVLVPEVLLVIAGEGPALAHVRALVSALGLADSVLFVGYLDRATDLPDCYRAADAFVFASRTETQGLVLLEAMAQGTPVVSTAVMGTAEVLAGTSGSVVVPEDEAVFAEAVAGLLRDRERRTRLSALAQLDAARWSSRAMAQRLLQVYDRLMRAEPVQAAGSRFSSEAR